MVGDRPALETASAATKPPPLLLPFSSPAGTPRVAAGGRNLRLAGVLMNTQALHICAFVREENRNQSGNPGLCFLLMLFFWGLNRRRAALAGLYRRM